MPDLPRVSRVLHGTTAEGPGLRTAVWFQGCSIRCRGCINPHLFSPHGGYDVQPEAVVEAALAGQDEGLTLIGGEPFDQPAAGAVLAQVAHREGLGVITFSGYVYEDLASRPEAKDLLAATDLLIDGPFRADDSERERALVGSTNQRFIHLTNRYEAYDPRRNRNRLDLRVGPRGEVEVAGFLDRPGLRALAEGAQMARAWKRP